MFNAHGCINKTPVFVPLMQDILVKTKSISSTTQTHFLWVMEYGTLVNLAIKMVLIGISALILHWKNLRTISSQRSERADNDKCSEMFNQRERRLANP